MKNAEQIRRELEESKLKISEKRSNSKERIERMRKKGEEIVDKTENWSRSGWEDMSDKQANTYSGFMKLIFRIIAIMLILLAIVFPPFIIISIVLFYLSFKFDAKKIKNDYKGSKSFILSIAGVLIMLISFVVPPLIILAVACFIAAYKEKKKNENESNLEEK
ncbi:MAG: hypothetical protein RR891_06325 [Clostridium sp.]|uniref:hypothetical protein n=1 Tax=Clostridium sp. TaxID=1506 RepID=UPI00303CA542